MRAIRKLLLPISIALLVAGLVFERIRTVAIPIGFGILLLTYVLEKLCSKNTRYRINDLSSTRCNRQGELSVKASQLLITDNWSLKGGLKLDGFNGFYNIDVHEMYNHALSLVSKVEIVNKALSATDAPSKTAEVNVDTGWLLFLSSSAVNEIKPSELKILISTELKNLPGNKPLILSVKNSEAANVGFVVSTGEGDGTYQVRYAVKDSNLVSVSATFIRRSKN